MTDTSAQAELDRLNYEIAVLEGRAEQARAAWAAVFSTLTAARHRRDQLVRYLASVPGPASCGLTSAGSEATGARREDEAAKAPGPARAERVPRSPEASTRTVQNLLFILGGLLLGSAAIVFTAVAWTTFGVTGRAVILAVVTGLTLAVPLVALRRRLTATAETFAALGLLLVLLDGYAAWKVNLLGITAFPVERYGAMVCAITGTVAALYHRATRLAAPAIAAVLAVQPVFPLLAGDLPPGSFTSALPWAGVALLNAGLVLGARRRIGWLRPALSAIAWIMYAVGLVGTIVWAVVLHIDPAGVTEAARASATALLAATVLATGAALVASPAARAVVASLVTLTVAGTATNLVSVASPDYTLVLAAGVVAATVGLTLAARLLVPAAIRPGLGAGAGVAAGALSAVLVGLTGIGLIRTITDALPPWGADLSVSAAADWQLLAALTLAAVALAAALPGPARRDVGVGGAALVALALPASIAMPWWAPSLVYLGAAAGLVGTAFVGSRHRSLARAAAAAGLTAGAVLAGLARPEQTALVLCGVIVLGTTVGLLSRPVDHRRIVTGSAGLVALMALPPAAWSGLVAVDVLPWWVARLTVAAVVVGLLATMAARRSRPGMVPYAYAATLISAALWPPVMAVVGAEPIGLYGGVALVLVATAVLAVLPGRAPQQDARARWGPAVMAAVPGAVLLTVYALPATLAVVALPYTWLGSVWSGQPAGVGLTPDGVDVTIRVLGEHAVALGLLAVASAIAAYAVTRRPGAALGGLGVGGPTAILAAAVATRAPWPTVPAVTLSLGLAIVLAVAMLGGRGVRATIASTQAVGYVGAGLAGMLTLEWSTLVGLGAVLLAFAAVGLAGRTPAWRVAGWTTSAAASLATAAAAGLAADLAPRTVAFAVLGAAALCLLGGAALARHRPTEGLPVQGVGQVGAAVALLFTAGSDRHAAAVCTLWGIAVGARALWPGTGRTARGAFAAVAGGFELVAWWLLLSDLDVALVEAYTLPLAGVALLAGYVAARHRPDLGSWVAYGPALAAAFLPSLGTVFGITSEGGDGQPGRRLLLGIGAMLVVLGGSVRRRQAPVVVGGAVLVIVALHEIALLWDRLPRWIPLALGGAVLVGLAITYERRRRDVARLREAVARMT